MGILMNNLFIKVVILNWRKVSRTHKSMILPEKGTMNIIISAVIYRVYRTSSVFVCKL